MLGARRDNETPRSECNPGDVFLDRVAGGPLEWWVCDLDGHFGSLGGYRVVEHDDGLITVQGPITNRVSGERFALEHGEWTRLDRPLL